MVIMTFNASGEKSILAEGDKNIDKGARLLSFFELYNSGTDTYMSKCLWHPSGTSGVYGGQIISQALTACFKTVPVEYFVHSLHSYFLHAASYEVPIIYKVERMRDRKSYITRAITATQGNKVVFTCSCSFSKPDKNFNLQHQAKMPNVTAAENTPTPMEFLESIIDRPEIPENIRKRLGIYKDFVINVLAGEMPVEYREVKLYTVEETLKGPKPDQNDKRWMRAIGSFDDDPRLHACMIAFSSDFDLLQTSARASGATYRNGGLVVVSSLDHSIWFHRQARADEWLLHDMNSPSASDGRGISFGKIYTHDGLLIASTAQEGVLRLSKREQDRRRKQAQSETEIKTKHGENNRL